VIWRGLPRIALGGLAVLVLATLGSAAAAANVVPPSRAGESTHARTLAQLAPPECAGITLTRLQIGPGGGGGGGNALILGSGAGGTLSGGGGRDCIVGGANNGTLEGQGGNDVLIGGPRWFTMLDGGGGGGDVCYRGQTFWPWLSGCETYVP